MNGFLNVLWHFPFLGFLFALFYALFGVVLCCTVILYPVGLGYFQIAQFLLAPFTSALVTRKDLDLVRPKEHSTMVTAYSTVITVLYFPFGLVAAIGALFVIVSEFVSIIGIPCGIVWFKALRAIFSPIGMICVPKAVGDEIERIKAGATVRQFKDEPEKQGRASECSSEAFSAQTEVRQYDDAKLNEIVSHATMYRSSLVNDCRRELEIRQGSEAFAAQVAAMDDAKLGEILSDSQLYAEELIYACTQEVAERRRRVREQQEREIELARIQHEKVVAETRVRRMAAWKKWRPYVFAGIAVFLLAGTGVGYYSYQKKQERLRKEQAAWAKLIEEQRIIEQERVEAEKKRVEEERMAAQRKQEQQRAAAERLKQEAKKILADENYRRSVGAYLVGEYHKELQGIVFFVDNTYKHGKVLSYREFPSTQAGDWKATMAWCRSLGKNWRLPTIEEWELIYKRTDVMNQLYLKTDWYRSSSRWSNDSHWRFHTGRGERYGCPDNNGRVYARAVSEF